MSSGAYEPESRQYRYAAGTSASYLRQPPCHRHRRLGIAQRPVAAREQVNGTKPLVVVDTAAQHPLPQGDRFLEGRFLLGAAVREEEAVHQRRHKPPLRGMLRQGGPQQLDVILDPAFAVVLAPLVQHRLDLLGPLATAAIKQPV